MNFELEKFYAQLRPRSIVPIQGKCLFLSWQAALAASLVRQVDAIQIVTGLHWNLMGEKELLISLESQVATDRTSLGKEIRGFLIDFTTAELTRNVRWYRPTANVHALDDINLLLVSSHYKGFEFDRERPDFNVQTLARVLSDPARPQRDRWTVVSMFDFTAPSEGSDK